MHWADEATLELVRFLGRRLDGMPLLAVMTFREDEAGAGTPLTALLGDLATAPFVDRMHLPPLTAGPVEALVAQTRSTVDAGALYRRTGGNYTMNGPFGVARAHAADLQTQEAYGVKYLRYWVNEAEGKIFCLVDAPNTDAANTVHREAYGLVADEIDPVSEGV